MKRVGRFEQGGSGSPVAAIAEAHESLARAVVEMHCSAERYLARQSRDLDVGSGGAEGGGFSPATLEALRRGSQVIVTYLSASLDHRVTGEAMETARGRRTLLDQLATAMDASGNVSTFSFAVTVVDRATATPIIAAITGVGDVREEGTPIAITGSAIDRDTLDTATGIEIMALFKRLHDQGNTIVLVTHEHDIAMHAHRIIHIRDGKVERDEPVAK